MSARSPYKKMRVQNNEWIPYTRINQLEKNKPYKMLGMVQTKNEKFGDGQCATMMHPTGSKIRTYLPKKYLALLTEEDINLIKGDIYGGKNIYFVFREVMHDNSYRIDLTEASESWIESYQKNLEVPELEDSITEEENEKQNQSNDQEKTDAVQ